ncbi:hypothetical protein CCR75_005211 [Bremia lactucae]|uniref:Uncharacterized protein n=1 Tax=Bremia lactucae TaxID=4779 RepID=A0A976FG41_BRELC|nr:hypothetical protein CCR75_005211 [Bremia lactucae]
MEDIDPNNVGTSVYGGMLAKASGIGKVRIITQVNDKEVELFVHDVLYVENADHGIFLHANGDRARF